MGPARGSAEMSSREAIIARWLRGTRNAAILILFTYQVLILVHQFQGALETYYFHLGLVLAVAALNQALRRLDAGRRPETWLLGVVLAAVIASCGYLYWNVEDVELRQPFLESADIYAGIAIVTCTLILTQMVWGNILAGVIGIAVVYFVFGDLFPGRFRYQTPEIGIVVSYLAGMGGARGVLWGIPLSANTLFLIIVFGGLLKGVRILELFNELGRLLLRISRGGICYSAILASALIGMVTGQAVANVVLSGSVTIPSMMQRGITPERAGALETVASLGSQLIPPIMGLGGFLMAVNLGVPYLTIVTAALLPAAIFVAILFVGGYFIAATTPGLVVTQEPVDYKLIGWLLPSFLVPFLTLLTMLYLRYSPGYAALWSIAMLLVLSMARRREYRPSFKRLWQGLEYGVSSAVDLALILAGIGIMVQVLITTGAGFELGRAIMLTAGGEIWIALIFGMLIAVSVGLGLPTPAAYALIAIIMIPSLIDLGIEPIIAHFFGFYFAIFSAITPPVAVGVMVASRISGGSFYGTAYEAARMSIISILLPFAFVAFPSLLGLPAIGFEGTLVAAVLIVTAILWGASVYGYLGRALSIQERVLLLAAPMLCIVMLLTRSLAVGGLLIVFATGFLFWSLASCRRQRQTERRIDATQT